MSRRDRSAQAAAAYSRSARASQISVFTRQIGISRTSWLSLSTMVRSLGSWISGSCVPRP